MSDSQKFKIKYAEDVKETFHLAEKLARRRGRSGDNGKIIPDREYLQAMLMANRPFSRTDALLRQMDIKPRELCKRLERELSAEEAGSEPESPFLEAVQAELFQELQPENGSATSNGSGVRMDVDHLLKAFCNSRDPVVRKVFQDYNITPDSIEKAQNRLHEKSLLNLSKAALFNILYILREMAEIVVIVLFFLVIIKEGLGEMRLIPSESMLPTLQVGDRLVIEKVTKWHRPYQRGDILVFYPPEGYAVLPQDPISVFMRMTGFSSLIHNQADDPIDKAYIKRLVGLPGETIVVIPGKGVFIDGRPLDEPYISEISLNCGDFCMPRKIPEGAYFMMGDNRNDSRDSRFFGFQPENRVIGRAVFRIWPLGRMGILEPSHPAN